jgi:hypothetical protein
MRNSYLFQDRNFTVRQVAGGWFILHACVVLFVVVGVSLEFRGYGRDLATTAAFAVTLPALVVAHLVFYRREQARLAGPDWGGLERNYRGLLKQMEHNYRKAKQNQRDITRVLGDYRDLIRKTQRARASAEVRAEIQEDYEKAAILYNEVNATVVEVAGTLRRLNKAHAEVSHYATPPSSVAALMQKAREQIANTDAQIKEKAQLEQRLRAAKIRI